MKPRCTHLTPVVALLFLAVGCETVPSALEEPAETLPAESKAKAGPRAEANDGPYEFEAAVFDIAAAPDGSILVAQNSSIREIRKGVIGDVIEVPTIPNSAINGLESIGRRSIFATSAGLDLAAGAGLWRVSAGGARLVADIEAFETAHDPDATKGPQWKDLQCEPAADPTFSAGPQSNPYHLTTLSGSEALVADAAGNTLLLAKSNGDIDWVAVFTPPVDENEDYRVLLPLDSDTDCYVQPVPTSVAVGPDGAYYVGELTGATAEGLPIGLSRVWRIEPGARNVVCPSGDCEEVISGLTSVIDLAFGPDGKLFVVEYDGNSWLAPFIGAVSAGTIRSCEIGTYTCQIVADDLILPSAITFDKWGNLWVLENNIGLEDELLGLEFPTVRKLN